MRPGLSRPFINHPPRYARSGGVTVVELMIVVFIIGVLTLIAAPSYQYVIDRKNTAQAETDIALIGTLASYYYNDNQAYPSGLADVGASAMVDPWGNPYQYHNTATGQGNGLARKDHSLHPLNTDFDLYSMGKDGQSRSPLTAQPSRDDIVRANNGAFIGLATDYSP
jgi:general secretion pathway protein G